MVAWMNRSSDSGETIYVAAEARPGEMMMMMNSDKIT
jgi:hypothetical protein